MNEYITSELAVKLIELACASGADHINLLPDAWEQPIGGEWRMAINGHSDRDVETQSSGCMKVTLSPYEMCVWRNGWVIALLHPVGDDGIVIGSTRMEDLLIDALDEALRKGRA